MTSETRFAVHRALRLGEGGVDVVAVANGGAADSQGVLC